MNWIISIGLLAMTAAFAIVFSQKTIDDDDNAAMLSDASQLKVLKRQMSDAFGRIQEQERQLQAIVQVQSTCSAACRPKSDTMC